MGQHEIQTMTVFHGAYIAKEERSGKLDGDHIRGLVEHSIQKTQELVGGEPLPKPRVTWLPKRATVEVSVMMVETTSAALRDEIITLAKSSGYLACTLTNVIEPKIASAIEGNTVMRTKIPMGVFDHNDPAVVIGFATDFLIRLEACMTVLGENGVLYGDDLQITLQAAYATPEAPGYTSVSSITMVFRITAGPFEGGDTRYDYYTYPTHWNWTTCSTHCTHMDCITYPIHSTTYTDQQLDQPHCSLLIPLPPCTTPHHAPPRPTAHHRAPPRATHHHTQYYALRATTSQHHHRHAPQRPHHRAPRVTVAPAFAPSSITATITSPATTATTAHLK